jgi:4'-phosphopantetheinyl transferase
MNLATQRLERYVPLAKGIMVRAIAAPFPIWIVSACGKPGPAVVNILSDAERERAGRFRFEADRNRYIAAHGALRILGERISGIPAGRQHYSANPYGKPRLTQQPDLQCSISHSANLSVVGWSRGPAIGLDLEVLRPIPDASSLMRHYFAPQESAALAELPSNTPHFLSVWVRKEACLKAIGLGLHIDPASFECGIDMKRLSLEVESTIISSEVYELENILMSWAIQLPGRVYSCMDDLC